MESVYRTVKATATAEFTERRSRFIGVLQPVSSAEEAAAFLATLKKQHRDARHICFAYRVGEMAKFSDDGEPAGTAGAPLMQVLERNELQDCVLAVVRYFGGILLGAGGLLRAYTHAGVLAVQAAQTVKMKTCAVFELCCDYALYGAVRPLLEQNGVLLQSDFEQEVRLKAALLPDRVGAVAAAITELSAGKLAGEVTGECALAFDEERA